MKVNANFKTFCSVHFDATKYIPSPSMGVNRFMLDRIGNEMARATTIVQYQPNSKFPEHTHVGGEEYLVLKGTFHDEYGTFPMGSYVRNPIGSKHAPWVEDDGCVIMVKLLQMAASDHITNPFHVNVNLNNNNVNYQPTDYGSVLDMYHNPQTGERVQMCWIKPNTIFPTSDTDTGGEEIFVYDGSLKMSFFNKEGEQQQQQQQEEIYEKWAWLRFPAGPQTTKSMMMLQAGSNGAHVYKKTGHLTEKAMSMEKIQIDPVTETVV